MLKKLKRLKFENLEVSLLQENVREKLDSFDDVFLSGRLIGEVQLGTATVNIPHLLDRSYQGFTLVDIQGDARVWRDTASAADPVKFISLRASASVKIKLWIF